MNWKLKEKKNKNILYIVNAFPVYFDQLNAFLHNERIDVRNKWIGTTVFNTDNKKKYFEQQSNILEWFPEDHVTLKTGVMMLNKFCFVSLD